MSKSPRPTPPSTEKAEKNRPKAKPSGTSVSVIDQGKLSPQEKHALKKYKASGKF